MGFFGPCMAAELAGLARPELVGVARHHAMLWGAGSGAEDQQPVTCVHSGSPDA